MAVYTEVSDEALATFIADYNIGSLLSCKGIAEGVENSNYLLRTSEGTFILTLYEKRVDPADLPFFLNLMDHLAKKGINCPTPIVDRRGQTLKVLANRPAALISFLEGMWIRRPQPDHCAALGINLAKMHVAGADFEMLRQNALSVGGWRPLFDACAADADAISPGLQDFISRELDHLEAQWPKKLPVGVIHADLFPDNVFFLGKEISGFIDFYFACNDLLAYDIAVCLNAWCFEVDCSFNITKARAFLRGYSSIRPLADVELQHLALLSRGAALRFLLTRLYDWVNTPAGALVKPKDPVEYLRKLRFHQSVNSARDYGIGDA